MALNFTEEDPARYIAVTEYGLFAVSRTLPGRWRLTEPEPSFSFGASFPTLDAAVAAAERSYRRLVMRYGTIAVRPASDAPPSDGPDR